MCRSFLLPAFIAAVLFAIPADAAEEAIEVQAFAGSPFGVALVRVPVIGDGLESQPADVTYHVESPEARVFYPAYFRETIPGSTDAGSVSARGTYFLFKGDEPLKVKFSDGRMTTEHDLSPRNDAEGRKALLTRWWGQYLRSAKATGAMPVVENYTTLMLARRLGLKPPAQSDPHSWNRDEMLGAFLGFEELRLAMQADRMLDDGDRPEPADQPLPTATLPPPISIPDARDAEIEPLADRVPEECFYLRFGSYGNYRWFRDTVSAWGGNLREIAVARSLDYAIQPRLEKQLVLKDSDLGKLLGETAISDMAVIGTDTFVREGASIGVLFRQKQPGILSAAIQTQRAAALAGGGVTEQKLDMAGKPVSLLTSAGNVVRSYYVMDGDYHFVTNSSTLARRFIETGAGKQRLSDLTEFQYARSKHPIGGGNPVLVYLSDPFIRQMVSPAYRVEMTRRMRAEADVELVSLARLAAIGEGATHDSVDDLVAGGFLPAKFGKRADETLPLIIDGIVVDSLRGARRTFLPVADVLVAAVTKSEAEAYVKFSQAYQSLYRRMDPVSISISREPAGADRERIVLDLSITPFTRQNLGSMANFLPPATHQQIATPADVLVMLEVGTKSRLFAGFVDRDIPWTMSQGQVAASRTFQAQPPVFIGEYGVAFRQMVGLRGEKSKDGYFSNPDLVDAEKSGRFGLDYGREWGDWWAVSLNKDTLPQVTPQLKITDGARPAQLRLRIGDLGASKAGGFLRAVKYARERETSHGNARLLDSFTEQLNVADNEAPAAARAVLGADVVCPLGGEYRRQPPDYQFSTHQPWYSTAWPATKEPWREQAFFERLSVSRLIAPPADYRPRLLDWFKGLSVEVMFDNQTMLSRVELTVRRGE